MINNVGDVKAERSFIGLSEMLSLRQSNEIIKAIKIEKKLKTSHGQ